MFLAHGFALAAIGLAFGVGCASDPTRLLGGLRFGVNPLDTLTYAAVRWD